MKQRVVKRPIRGKSHIGRGKRKKAMADSSPQQPPRAQWYRSLTILVFLEDIKFQ
jgi:hypothetical protein